MRRSALALVLLLALIAAPVAPAPAQSRLLPLPVAVAPGLRYYTFDSAEYFGQSEPISIRLLEVDPDETVMDVEYGRGGVQGRATVPAMAARRGATAAVNAGFFGATGDPSGIYKVDGLLVSDTLRPRAAVGFAEPNGAPLLFGRVAAHAGIVAGGQKLRVRGIDTARGANALTLYTPRFGPSTRTSSESGGMEWALSGDPLRVAAMSAAGDLLIPERGFVASVSGTIPDVLRALAKGDRVDVTFEYESDGGAPAAAWQQADDIIGGAGLLLWRGAEVHDWTAESLDRQGFVDARHPRTVIGRDADGDTWLVVVDGRRPDHSVGMSLPELVAFGKAIGLVDALNLDGGGSSTLVLKGEVVNRPTDPIGPRPVSDAIVVFSGRSSRPPG